MASRVREADKVQNISCSLKGALGPWDARYVISVCQVLANCYEGTPLATLAFGISAKVVLILPSLSPQVNEIHINALVASLWSPRWFQN